jgi:hypothetical protein
VLDRELKLGLIAICIQAFLIFCVILGFIFMAVSGFKFSTLFDVGFFMSVSALILSIIHSILMVYFGLNGFIRFY